MTTVRQRAKTVAQPKKKVVKPVLTNPHILQWPELSQPAQAQIEASLWHLLKPLVEVREHQYDQQPSDSQVESPPLASTSKLVLDDPIPHQGDTAIASDNSNTVPRSTSEDVEVISSMDVKCTDPSQPPFLLSKRAKHREHLRKKVEKRDAHLDTGHHEIDLRSGKTVQIPDRPQPEGFRRKLHLDKRQAMKSRPAICDDMIIGLNAVTRSLEESIEGGRRELAGFPPVLRSSTVTAKDNLRLFVPTPTRGTRRDRRALRQTLHPKSRADKLGAKRDRVLDNLQDMPPYLVVPRNEPALVFAFQDMRSRLEKAIRTPTESGYLSIITDLLPIIADGGSMPDGSAGEADMSDTEAVPRNQMSAQLPTEIVISLLFANERPVVDDRDRSILLSLFTRFDPEWFRIWSLRRQAMARLGQLDRLSRQVQKAEESSVAPVKGRPLQLIFVAKADINPLQIVQHLLTAVGAHNSLNIARRKAQDGNTEEESEPIVAHNDIYLVPLSKGAEQKLAGLLALRRVSVLAFTASDLPEYKKVVDLVKVHLGQPLSAEWLIPAINGLGGIMSQQGNLVPTHIKYLQTTTPTDVKALRVEKQGEKKRKREESRSKAASDRKNKTARTGGMGAQQA